MSVLSLHYCQVQSLVLSYYICSDYWYVLCLNLPKYFFQQLSLLLHPWAPVRSAILECVCLSVCLFVCLHAYLKNHVTTPSNLTRFSVHVACGYGSVFLWWHCNSLCTSNFVVDVRFSYNGPSSGSLQCRARANASALWYWLHPVLNNSRHQGWTSPSRNGRVYVAALPSSVVRAWSARVLCL